MLFLISKLLINYIGKKMKHLTELPEVGEKVVVE